MCASQMYLYAPVKPTKSEDSQCVEGVSIGLMSVMKTIHKHNVKHTITVVQ